MVDYQTSDYTADQQRYDLVFDTVGKIRFRDCRHLIKPGGRYASSELGPYAENFRLVVTTRWSKRARVIFAFPVHDQRMVERFAELMADGQFRPLIDRTYSIDRIVEAYEYVESGTKIGNVIISV